MHCCVLCTVLVGLHDAHGKSVVHGRWVCTTISVVCYASAVLCFSIAVSRVLWCVRIKCATPLVRCALSHSITSMSRCLGAFTITQNKPYTSNIYPYRINAYIDWIDHRDCMNITLEVRIRQPTVVRSWLHWCAHNKINKIITKYPPVFSAHSAVQRNFQVSWMQLTTFLVHQF